MADEHLISLQPGTVIAGRYEVVKCLGAGSMGLVYACRHRELAGHLVAVKVLFPEVAQDKIAAQRFRNEIFASYGVSHPNVVRAYEYLRDGDMVAYTMEYVDGGALADRLERTDRVLSIAEIVNYLSQMCLGVQAIHDAGIVHRDLKPENILLTKDNIVKIADFGIARYGHGPRLTEHGGVVGTIDYVSPEYMLNSQVDWRSDIYALGILGYEMIAGESPFRGDSVYATMTKRLKSDAKPPSELRKECPKKLDSIILKAMARDPESRYQSTLEMFYALQELMPHQSGTPGGFAAGAFVRKLPNGSTQYTGPVLNSSQIAPESESLEPNFVAKPAAVPAPKENGARNGMRVVSQPAALREWDSGAPLRSEDHDSLADTQIIDPNSVNPDTEIIEDTIHEPVKMEKMLVYKDLVSGTWENPLVPKEVNIPTSSLDEQRIKRLSQFAENVNRSIWLDVATSIVAIIIGVGVGIAVLRVIKPGWFDRHAVQEVGKAGTTIGD